MTHLDFVSAKEALPRLASTLNPLSKGFSFIIHQECVRSLAYAQDDIPHFVVPSGSEASLTSFGTASSGGDPSLLLGVTKKERLGVRRREKEKFNNKIKKGGSLRVCSRT
jgi:hypothetical protein